MRWVRATFLLLLASASAHAEALSVSQPASGATLRGGSYAPLAWTADSLPAGAGEWEAFLSIDGGEHYVFRITPHVDLELHRILWLVPNVDAKDARLLLRVGNEREEQGFEVALTLTIERDPRAPLPRRSIIPAGPGEPARAGEPGVIGWIEGDRKATRTTEVWQAEPAGLMQSLRVVLAADPVDAIAPQSARVLLLMPVAAREASEPPRCLACLAIPSQPILLRSCRRNI